MCEALEKSGILFECGATHSHASQAALLMREGLALDAIRAQTTFIALCSNAMPWSHRRSRRSNRRALISDLSCQLGLRVCLVEGEAPGGFIARISQLNPLFIWQEPI